MSNVDVLVLDQKIQETLLNSKRDLEKYYKLREELERTNENENLTHRARADIKKSLDDVNKKIYDIENSSDLEFYVTETIDIVEKYREILKTPIKLSFLGPSRTDSKSGAGEKSDPKSEIVKTYLDIVQRISNPEIQSIVQAITTSKIEKKNRLQSEKNKEIVNLSAKENTICNNCQNKERFAIEENTYICLDCSSQQEMLQNSVSYKDSDRVNISARYTYDRKVHFRDCINQYQGKQNCSIPQSVYDDLEEILDRHRLLLPLGVVKPRGTSSLETRKTSSQVRDDSRDSRNSRESRETSFENPLSDSKTLPEPLSEFDKRRRFSNVTKEHILMFLKELGYVKQYENVNLIHYNMTGKKPDDISHLEDQLLNDFDLLIETYDKMFKNKVDRVNFISTQYVLYQLLRRHKHPCRREDFVILKTIDRKAFHDEVCGELFSQLGFSFHPIL